MIQRIQTVYLFISIICLSVVTSGVSILNFKSEDGTMILSSFGLEEFDSTFKSIKLISYPYFISTLMLTVLCLLTILSYKNLKNQLKLIRIILMIYVFLIVGLLFFAFLANFSLTESRVFPKLGLGFYLFLVGFPLVFLANLGVKKDKNLLDSVNRLR
jgi:hypothetical protein